MSTVNFSIPEAIKKAFNRTFEGENKSAVLARLMQQAIDERKRQKRRAAAIETLLKVRAGAKPVSEATIRKARRKGRP
jgi:hypothetical protein